MSFFHDFVSSPVYATEHLIRAFGDSGSGVIIFTLIILALVGYSFGCSLRIKNISEICFFGLSIALVLTWLVIYYVAWFSVGLMYASQAYTINRFFIHATDLDVRLCVLCLSMVGTSFVPLCMAILGYSHQEPAHKSHPHLIGN
jgi:membrane-associated HD superfamily phosphohydrolase